MSKTSLKKLLNGMDRDQLVEVMLELYDARKEARDYLEYYANPDENKMLEKYKGVIHKEFFPQKGRAKGRTSVCKKALKEFSTLHPSPRRIADLRLYLIESIYSYAVKMRSWVKESQEATALSIFEDTLQYLFTNDLTADFQRRIDNILLTAATLRGPLRTRIKEIYDFHLESTR